MEKVFSINGVDYEVRQNCIGEYLVDTNDGFTVHTFYGGTSYVEALETIIKIAGDYNYYVTEEC